MTNDNKGLTALVTFTVFVLELDNRFEPLAVRPEFHTEGCLADCCKPKPPTLDKVKWP